MAINIDYKKTTKEVLTIIPLLLTSGYFILWLYLDDIGQLGLLPSLLDDKGALIALITSFFILSASLIFIFSLPSMILCQMCFLTWNNEFARVIDLNKIPLISCFISILYIIVIATLSNFDWISHYIKDYIFIISLGLFSPLTYILVHTSSRKRKKIHIYYKNGKEVRNKKFIKEKIIISFFSLLSGLTITIPLLFILNLSTANNYLGLTIFIIFSFFLVLVSFMPALIFLSENNIKSNIKGKILFFITTALAFFFIIMLLLPGFSGLIVSGALKNIGIIENESHLYAINNKIYTKNMFPNSIWRNLPINNEKYFFINGTVIFSLGNKILICPGFVMKVQNKYRKYNLDNSFTPDVTEFQTKHLKKIIKSCVLINKPDITRWDGILDGENILNL
ncbi:hypothetical protein EJP617_32220 [Erwinia sp. Ejp617]|nr:hypothetical protein [Erwinia sp. Ejp617]ADP12903.1 hypothetical protein EJP617_32220 [Erwinia sp. Ejp617]